jgi:hypothetical protein
MKPRILQLLVFVLLVGTWGFAEAEEHKNLGLEPLKLYDNFEQALINPDKWRGDQFQTGGYYQELVRKITPEEHHLRILNRSFGQTFFNGGNTLNLFRLAFTRPDTITAIRSRVQVRNVESKGCPTYLNSTPTLATAQIFGFFFNTTGTVPGNGTSDVIAGVSPQRRSDSTDPPDVLEIFYFVALCADPNCVVSPYLGSGVLGTVKTGEWVRLLVQWDKDQDRFIFQRDSEPPRFVSYQGYSDAAAPGIQLKTLGADNFVASCINTPRPVGMVDALFDNVFVNRSALP